MSAAVQKHARASAGKTAALISIIAAGGRPENILVVGCGDGREAGMLARHFDVPTIGVDLAGAFADADAAPALLLVMDALDLAFSDETFDLVYSFHALEHISNPVQALLEMRRVLKPEGRYVVGTPNKSRLVGYIGSPVSIQRRVKWNLDDLRARAAGRWSNEAGAHAGFTAEELGEMCDEVFGTADEVSHEYYSTLYSSKRTLINWLVRTHACRVVFPSVYVTGRRL